MATASSPLEQLAEQRAACSSTSEGNTSNHDDRRKVGRPAAHAALERPMHRCHTSRLARGAGAGASWRWGHGVWSDPACLPQLINKMMYRSKQRGWLELDLLVGLWAEEHIPRMAVDMLHSYAAVLEEVRERCSTKRAPPRALAACGSRVADGFRARRRTPTCTSGSLASWTRRSTCRRTQLSG